MRFNPAFILAALPVLVSAGNAPGISGYRLVWQDNFSGPSGQLPDESKWEIIDRNLGVNGELQTYKRSNHNLQKSGGETLQLIPWREGNSWTSGRVESWYTFTPEAGKRTLAQAEIRFGGNDIRNKQGIWPAFWTLGQSIRTGTKWPACGEVDILETVNGQLKGYGTVHCDVSPGGICREFEGIGAAIDIPDQSWHTWTAVWDRTSNDWTRETITWFRDGQQYHKIDGARIGNFAVWQSLAQKPLFFILNVAVGGQWPGYPNDITYDGYGAMMEVRYVAHYVSN
ncbi:glycoside hydrolase [Rhypophila decipiens]|uniref:Glycoside hydrolase n=1 Tax=Rhypophila decipiens TaxID=261697 RepID=A0AAN7B4P1_9PEZI|nr:glycoside hydrolase [Rhypophila decipiens]